MPEISKITLPSGTTYDIKDATARAAISGGTVFLGITATPLTDGASTSPIIIDGESVNAINGGIVIYNNKEFIYADVDSKWHEIGDTGNLGALAYKDNATGTFTPSGTVSQPTFSGSSTTSTGKYTPSGTVSQPTFTGSEGSVSVSGTPSGSISTPTITVTADTTTKYVADSTTGGGSVTDGSAASCTLPVLTTSVANETLTIGWSAGSFSANTPTVVTLPTFSSQTIAVGIDSASASQPTFTGAVMTASGNFTPEGTVSKPSFTGTEGDISVSGTPTGTISQPTFTGTDGTVTVS